MDYFDYSFEGYGKPDYPVSKYSFFLNIEATHISGVLELELCFYYRLQDKSVIEFILGIPSDEEEQSHFIIGRFRLEEPFHRQLLKHYIRKFIMDGRNYLGLGYIFKESTIMGERQFKHMMDDILADLQINRYYQQTKWKDSPIAELCYKYGLEILPTDGEDYLAECWCPAGHSHRLQLNLDSGSWYCGYCRKKGHLKELKKLIVKYRNND